MLMDLVFIGSIIGGLLYWDNENSINKINWYSYDVLYEDFLWYD